MYDLPIPFRTRRIESPRRSFDVRSYIWICRGPVRFPVVKLLSEWAVAVDRGLCENDRNGNTERLLATIATFFIGRVSLATWDNPPLVRICAAADKRPRPRTCRSGCMPPFIPILYIQIMYLSSLSYKNSNKPFRTQHPAQFITRTFYRDIVKWIM